MYDPWTWTKGCGEWEWEGGAGQRGIKGGKWNNCNRIIIKYILKINKTLLSGQSHNVFFHVLSIFFYPKHPLNNHRPLFPLWLPSVSFCFPCLFYKPLKSCPCAIWRCIKLLALNLWTASINLPKPSQEQLLSSSWWNADCSSSRSKGGGIPHSVICPNLSCCPLSFHSSIVLNVDWTSVFCLCDSHQALLPGCYCA